MKLMLITFIALVGLFLLYFFAGDYSNSWWNDILKHYIGGLLAALLVASFFEWRYEETFSSLPFFLKFSAISLCAITLGVLYELLEFVAFKLHWMALVHHYKLSALYIDTIDDLFWDVAGSAMGAFMYAICSLIDVKNKQRKE